MDIGISPNPAGGPASGPSYRYLEIHNAKAKRVNAAKTRFGWDSVVCYYQAIQNKDSILLLEPDAKQAASCDTTHALYAVLQEKDSIGVLHMEAYQRDPDGAPGLWRTVRKGPPAETIYLLLEKDSISFGQLETKFPYRASGDSIYFTTQYGESAILVKYFEGFLLSAISGTIMYQKR